MTRIVGLCSSFQTGCASFDSSGDGRIVPERSEDAVTQAGDRTTRNL